MLHPVPHDKFPSPLSSEAGERAGKRSNTRVSWYVGYSAVDLTHPTIATLGHPLFVCGGKRESIRYK
jgi:hypothetical protein